MPEDSNTSTLVRLLKRAMPAPPTNGGIPWKRIGVIAGTLTACVVLFATVEARGWLPTMEITFDEHVAEQESTFAVHLAEAFVPLQNQAECTKCIQDCMALFCYDERGRHCKFSRCRTLCEEAGACK